MPAHRKDAQAALRVLGARIAELRRERGISQESLAWESGIHTNHLSTIERGIANPSLAVLLAISGVLGMTAAELLKGIEKMKPPKKTAQKKTPRSEDFNQGAFRIVQQATRAKPKIARLKPKKSRD